MEDLLMINFQNRRTIVTGGVSNSLSFPHVGFKSINFMFWDYIDNFSDDQRQFHYC